MKKLLLPLILITGILFISCNDDDPVDLTRDLSLSISNLAESGSADQYEGWIIVDGAPVSTGTFTVNASGDYHKAHFQLISTCSPPLRPLF